MDNCWRKLTLTIATFENWPIWICKSRNLKAAYHRIKHVSTDWTIKCTESTTRAGVHIISQRLCFAFKLRMATISDHNPAINQSVRPSKRKLNNQRPNDSYYTHGSFTKRRCHPLIIAPDLKRNKKQGKNVEASKNGQLGTITVLSDRIGGTIGGKRLERSWIINRDR